MDMRVFLFGEKKKRKSEEARMGVKFGEELEQRNAPVR